MILSRLIVVNQKNDIVLGKKVYPFDNKDSREYFGKVCPFDNYILWVEVY